ncbi:MAG: hypothetical protein V2B15_16055 [Bacteroidota bacterium]
MTRKTLLICPLLLVFLLMGCRRVKELPETIDANYIEYEIEYLEDRAGDIPTKILPGTMDAYYTKYYVLTRINGFFNQFTLTQISDLKRKRVTTLLNFFGNKVCYAGEPGELPAGIVEPALMKIHLTGETSVIGGLNSEKLDVETDQENYSIYFTKDFSVRRPNISTPYRMVDDPLTDFRIQLSLLKMHLSCSSMEFKAVESKIFTIPKEYKAVNRATMEEIINSLFTKD